MKRTVFIFLLMVVCSFAISSVVAADVKVKGHMRDGKWIKPHYRSEPDGNFNNNWSTKGNINPYTGEVGTKTDDGSPSYYYSDEQLQGIEQQLEELRSQIEAPDFSNMLDEERKKLLDEYEKQRVEWERAIQRHQEEADKLELQIQESIEELDKIGDNYQPPTFEAYTSPLTEEVEYQPKADDYSFVEPVDEKQKEKASKEKDENIEKKDHKNFFKRIIDNIISFFN